MRTDPQYSIGQATYFLDTVTQRFPVKIGLFSIELKQFIFQILKEKQQKYDKNEWNLFKAASLQILD